MVHYDRSSIKAARCGRVSCNNSRWLRGTARVYKMYLQRFLKIQHINLVKPTSIGSAVDYHQKSTDNLLDIRHFAHLMDAGATRTECVTTKLPRNVCVERDRVERCEFLVTNGIGGYASLTTACKNTRSYHGLLIAALRPPLDRTLLLTRLDEMVIYKRRTFDLTTPNYVRLEGSVPVFTYEICDTILEKRIWMKQGQNTVFVSYRMCQETAASATTEMRLDVKALINHRDHHARTDTKNRTFQSTTTLLKPDVVRIAFKLEDDTSTELLMGVEKNVACVANSRTAEIKLEKERERGYPYLDAALHAASFKVRVSCGTSVTFYATTESEAKIKIEDELQLQHKYEIELLKRYEGVRLKLNKWAPNAYDESIRQLVLAADQFIIRRAGGHSILAGYHWFTDWTRDVGQFLSVVV